MICVCTWGKNHSHVRDCPKLCYVSKHTYNIFPSKLGLFPSHHNLSVPFLRWTTLLSKSYGSRVSIYFESNRLMYIILTLYSILLNEVTLYSDTCLLFIFGLSFFFCESTWYKFFLYTCRLVFWLVLEDIALVYWIIFMQDLLS